VEKVFRDELAGMEINMPYHPLYLTPLAIASYED
jgi:Ethanolamine utilization protein EutJ (predicted chaperonin)